MGTSEKMKDNWLLWLLVAIAAVIAIIQGLSFSELFNKNAPTMLVIVSIFFTFIHAYRRYGFKDFLVFLTIVFVIGNIYENLSIMTTFPFGAYHYTDSLGPKFMYVPLIINIAYFQMIYIAWTLSGAVIDHFKNRLQGIYIVVQPLAAMFIMVMWDLVIDPYMSTVSHHWEWLEGGAYYGVPFQNFLGWFLCVYTMYQLFAFYISKNSTISTPAFVFEKGYWAQFVCQYLTWPFSFLIKGVCISHEAVTAFNAQIWNIKDISQTAGIVGLCTMFFVGFLVFLRVFLQDSLMNKGNEV